MLDPAGPSAASIDDLWWLMLALGSVVLALVAVVLAVGLTRRRGDDGDDDDDSGGDVLSPAGRRLVLWGGVALPAFTVIGLLAATIGVMATEPEADGDTLAVDVIGHQWWWEIRYPELGVETANELHIPAGQQVELRLRSADVIHSFWVPALAGKMDLLPEVTNSLIIEADEPGRYQGACAEFCGLQHARMGLVVVAEEPGDFERWAERQAQPAVPSTDEGRRGLEVLSSAGCGSCHTVQGTAADGGDGPDLTHLRDRSTLAAGTLPLTADNLRTWIDDPHSVKAGTAMEPADLDDDELDALVAYLLEGDR